MQNIIIIYKKKIKICNIRKTSIRFSNCFSLSQHCIKKNKLKSHHNSIKKQGGKRSVIKRKQRVIKQVINK